MTTITSTPDTLITTSLEMTTQNAFRPAYSDDPSIQVVRMGEVDLEFYLFLYSSVGGVWHWRDRLLMDRAELRAALSDPNTGVYILYLNGVPAGYVELARQGDSTEVAYFGLRQGYMGRGLGKHLLSCGIAAAWDAGAKRIWVHTCNLDAPYALENYLKRGFTVYHIEEKPMPARYR